jgi:excisionase family DNA binding protein
VTEPVVRLTEPLLDAKEAAALLNVPRSTLYELVRCGRLPALRLGRHLRWSRAMLEAALAAQLEPERRSRP